MIDFTAGGIFAAALGTRSRVIKRAISRVDDVCCYAPRFGNYWRERYYELLREVTGFECAVAFCEGSVAVEACWRICRVYTGRPGIWGGLVDPDEVGSDRPRCDAFHGWTLGAMIAAGRMTYPELGIYPELGASRFGQSSSMTACMIIEPYHAPSAQFHRIDPTINRIRGLQEEFPDILLCIDEIQGGFGRTGKMFAYEHYDGLKPDFVTVGKLAGGGMPLSAVLGPKEIMESDAVKEFGHLHSTHSGHPVMCSIGIAVLEEIIGQKLIERSAELGFLLHQGLSSFPVQTHGKGLMAGLAFRDKEEADEVVRECEERELLIVPTGRKWAKIGPKLTISRKDLKRGIEILREVVEEVMLQR